MDPVQDLVLVVALVARALVLVAHVPVVALVDLQLAVVSVAVQLEADLADVLVAVRVDPVVLVDLAVLLVAVPVVLLVAVVVPVGAVVHHSGVHVESAVISKSSSRRKCRCISRRMLRFLKAKSLSSVVQRRATLVRSSIEPVVTLFASSSFKVPT